MAVIVVTGIGVRLGIGFALGGSSFWAGSALVRVGDNVYAGGCAVGVADVDSVAVGVKLNRSDGATRVLVGKGDSVVAADLIDKDGRVAVGWVVLGGVLLHTGLVGSRSVGRATTEIGVKSLIAGADLVFSSCR